MLFQHWKIKIVMRIQNYTFKSLNQLFWFIKFFCQSTKLFFNIFSTFFTKTNWVLNQRHKSSTTCSSISCWCSRPVDVLPRSLPSDRSSRVGCVGGVSQLQHFSFPSFRLRNSRIFSVFCFSSNLFAQNFHTEALLNIVLTVPEWITREREINGVNQLNPLSTSAQSS